MDQITTAKQIARTPSTSNNILLYKSSSVLSVHTTSLPSTSARLSNRSARLTGALRKGFISAVALTPQSANSAIRDLSGTLAPERFASLPSRSRAAAKALIVVSLTRSLSEAQTLAARHQVPDEDQSEDSTWYDAVAAAINPSFEFPVEPLAFLNLPFTDDQKKSLSSQVPVQSLSSDNIFGIGCWNSIVNKSNLKEPSDKSKQSTYRPYLQMTFSELDGFPLLDLHFKEIVEDEQNEGDTNSVPNGNDITSTDTNGLSRKDQQSTSASLLSSKRLQHDNPHYTIREHRPSFLDQLLQELNIDQAPGLKQKTVSPTSPTPEVVVVDSSSKQISSTPVSKPSTTKSQAMIDRKRKRQKRARATLSENEKGEMNRKDLERVRNVVISTMQEEPKSLTKRPIGNGLISTQKHASTPTKGHNLRDRPARRVSAPSRIVESDRSDSEDNYQADSNGSDEDFEPTKQAMDVDLEIIETSDAIISRKNVDVQDTQKRGSAKQSNPNSAVKPSNASTAAIKSSGQNDVVELSGPTKVVSATKALETSNAKQDAAGKRKSTGKSNNRNSAAQNAGKSRARPTTSKKPTKSGSRIKTRSKIKSKESGNDNESDDSPLARNLARELHADDEREIDVNPLDREEEEEILEESHGPNQILHTETPTKSNREETRKRDVSPLRHDLWRMPLHETEDLMETGDTGSISIPSSSSDDDSRPHGLRIPILTRVVRTVIEGKRTLLEVDKFDENEDKKEYSKNKRNYEFTYDENGTSPATQFTIRNYREHKTAREQAIANTNRAAPVDDVVNNPIIPNNLNLDFMNDAVVNIDSDSSHTSSSNSSSGEENHDDSDDDIRTERGSSRRKTTKPSELRTRVCSGLLETMTTDAKKKVLRWARRDYSWFDPNLDWSEVVAKRESVSCDRCETIDGARPQCEESIIIKLWKDMSWRRVRRMRHKRPGKN